MLFLHVLGMATLLGCLVVHIMAHESEREERAAVWAARLRKPGYVALALLFLSGGHLAFATGLLHGESAVLLLVKMGLGLSAIFLCFALFLPSEPAGTPQAALLRPALLRLALVLALTTAFLGTWIAAAGLPERPTAAG